jgi:hypothetical protein
MIARTSPRYDLYLAVAPYSGSVEELLQVRFYSVLGDAMEI